MAVARENGPCWSAGLGIVRPTRCQLRHHRSGACRHGQRIVANRCYLDSGTAIGPVAQWIRHQLMYDPWLLARLLKTLVIFKLQGSTLHYIAPYHFASCLDPPPLKRVLQPHTLQISWVQNAFSLVFLPMIYSTLRLPRRIIWTPAISSPEAPKPHHSAPMLYSTLQPPTPHSRAHHETLPEGPNPYHSAPMPHSPPAPRDGLL